MYNYSPIQKIYIRNFRNLGDVEIDFSESPIISLLGENEAGKTSIIKAFSTCALHANPRDQKDFIRDETDMFGVAIDLADGTRIVRMKQTSGVNSYSVQRPDGTNWTVGKITDGLPEEVRKIMGLISEPETNEFLHIRTYEDKLLFVVTPNSTNYKVMYNALKVEQLTKAIKAGSGEVNELKSKINKNEISIDTLNRQYKSINIVDTESLVDIKNNIKKQLAILDKLEKAIQLLNKIDSCENKLGALLLIDKFSLSEINELLSSRLNNVNNLLMSYNRLNKLSSILNSLSDVSEIDTDPLLKLRNIINKKHKLELKISEAGAIVSVKDLEEISEVKVTRLNIAMNSLIDLLHKENRLKLIDTDSCELISQADISSVSQLLKMLDMKSKISINNDNINKINKYVNDVNNYLKSLGVAFETCPNCGSDIVIDIDKI